MDERIVASKVGELALRWRDQMYKLRATRTELPHVGTDWFNSELNGLFGARRSEIIREVIRVDPARLAETLSERGDHAWLPLFFQHWLRALSQLLLVPKLARLWELDSGDSGRLMLQLVDLEQACIVWLRSQGLPAWGTCDGIYGVFSARERGQPATSPDEKPDEVVGCHVITCLIVPIDARAAQTVTGNGQSDTEQHASPGIYAGNFEPLEACQVGLDAALAAVQDGLLRACIKNAAFRAFLPLIPLRAAVEWYSALSVHRILRSARIYVTIGDSAARGPVHRVDGESLSLSVALAILLGLASLSQRSAPSLIRALARRLQAQGFSVVCTGGLTDNGACISVALADKPEIVRRYPRLRTMYLPTGNEGDLCKELGLSKGEPTLLASLFAKRQFDLPRDGASGTDPPGKYRGRPDLWQVVDDLLARKKRRATAIGLNLGIPLMAVIFLVGMQVYRFDLAVPPELDGGWAGAARINHYGPDAMRAKVPRPSAGGLIRDEDLSSVPLILHIRRDQTYIWSGWVNGLWQVQLKASVGSLRALGDDAAYAPKNTVRLPVTGDYVAVEYRYPAALEGGHDPIEVSRQLGTRRVGGLTLYIRPESAAAPDGGPGRPNIIVYLMDTLRADRVGPNRSGESITPGIDAFAASATVFANAVAQAPWTKPSVTSIFTGLGPLVHGMRGIHDRLPPEAVTAAELLHAGGYQTAAFSTNWNVARETGLAQGFDVFDYAPGEAASDRLNQRVFQWLESQAKPPFFLYVHSLDPHAPYTPPPTYRERFAPGIRSEAGSAADMKRIWPARGKERRRLMAEIPPLYDAEVAFNDHSFGDFLDALRRRGFHDDALIIFVSDHGEEFDEHGDFGHRANLHNETLDVPLIVKWPGQRRGQRAAAIAQHVDLFPTLLRAAGLPVPRGLPGLDLAQVAALEEDGRWVISHLSHRSREGISVVHAGWKLIHPLTRELAETPLLYRRSTDPAERTNQLGDFPVRAGWLESLIRREQERGKRGLKTQAYEMDEETRKGLEALGYL